MGVCSYTINTYLGARGSWGPVVSFFFGSLGSSIFNLEVEGGEKALKLNMLHLKSFPLEVWRFRTWKPSFSGSMLNLGRVAMNTPFGFIKDPGAKQFFFEILCNHFGDGKDLFGMLDLVLSMLAWNDPYPTVVPLPSFHGRMMSTFALIEMETKVRWMARCLGGMLCWLVAPWKFNLAPENIPSKRKGSSSTHHFSGASC